MASLMLIDGNSIINRAFYGQGRGGQLTAPDGTPTGAVFTFLNMYLKYVNEYQPTHVCVAFDRPEPTFRHKRYADYKKNRTGMPDDLALQMPILKALLKAMNVCTAELPGYEADDLIGTLSERFGSEEMKVYILSGDRDDFQLLNEHVQQLYPTNMSGITVYTPELLLEKHGYRPDQVIDMKALMGDSSDSIPGIRGIGEKTALKLLQEYETLDNVLAHKDEVKGAVGKKLREGVEDALLSKELAAIDLEVPLEIEADDMLLEEYDKPSLLKLFVSLDFRSLVPRFGLDEIESEEDSRKARPFKLLHLPEEADGLFPEGETVYAALCPEASEEGKIYFMADLPEADEQIFYASDLSSGKMIRAFLDKIGRGRKRIAFDAKAVYKALDYYPDEAFEDLGIAAYLAGLENFGDRLSDLYPLLMNDGLPALGEASGDSEKEASEAELVVLAELSAAPAVYRELDKILEERRLKKLALEMEYPLAAVLAGMEKRGVKVDAEILEGLGAEFRARAEELEQRIYFEAGHEFNVNSPKQLGEVLFEEMGIRAGRKTAGGNYSTAASELERLAPFHPIVEDVLAYRKVSKLDSTFIQGLIKEINEDGRIHTSFNQTLTATGRLSSSEPNLQNIPMRENEGRQIRRAFVPKEGYVFLDADYSQIELRLLAALSEDENLLDAFRHGKDIHKRTASGIFAVPEDEVTAEQRAAAKTVNFSIIYGISDYGLAQDLKITRKEAHQYIEGYHERYPAVEPYMEKLIEFGHEHGYVETYFGRRRYIKELSAKNYNVRKFGERAAMNAPVQGTAADIIKIAMLKVNKAILEHELDGAILLQVHDELLLEVREEQADLGAKLLQEAMESAAELPIPLKAEVKRGKNWFDCK